MAFSLGRVTAALLAPAMAAANTATPARAPDLDAVVRYEMRQVLPSGVSRVETWSERLVRRGDTVWTERLGATPRTAGAASHREFDTDAAARLLTVDARGQVRLRYVDATRRLAVTVPPAEWATVGFDGRHDAAAHLVPPALIDALPVAKNVCGGGDAWRVQKNGGWSHCVRWSAARQVALRIESRSDDGRTSRSVTLLPQAAAAVLPWRAVDGYDQREYNDFMD